MNAVTIVAIIGGILAIFLLIYLFFMLFKKED